MSTSSEPAVTGVEVVGFVAWITSSLAYVLYILWAFTPAPILEAHAISYYPSKYWAVALPTWFCVTVVFVYWVYQSLNMIHTLSSTELEATFNSADPALLEKKFFSRPGDAALLPLVELPPQVVAAVLRDGQAPLEAEAAFKKQLRAQLAAAGEALGADGGADDGD